MTPRPLALLALAAALTASAAAPAVAQDPAQQSPAAQRDEAAIYAAIHRLETAWRAGNATDLAINFAPGAVLVGFGDRVVEGRNAIEAHYSDAFAGRFANTELEHLADDLGIRFLAADVAVATYEGAIGPTTDAVRPACSPVVTVMLGREPSQYSADGEWVIQYLAMADSLPSDCIGPGR